jgi:hypothetical protein
VFAEAIKNGDAHKIVFDKNIEQGTSNKIIIATAFSFVLKFTWMFSLLLGGQREIRERESNITS